MIKRISIRNAPCVWCGALQEQHVNGIQCLFGPTRHSPISPMELSALSCLQDGERAHATELYGRFEEGVQGSLVHVFHYVLHYPDGRGGDSVVNVTSDWIRSARK